MKTDLSEIIALMIVGIAVYFVIRRFVSKRKKGSCCDEGCHPAKQKNPDGKLYQIMDNES